MGEPEDIQRELQARKSLKDRPSRARYNKVREELDRKWRRRELKTDRMMKEIVDELWDQFSGAPYSWCGFYVLAPSGEELILGPHRDKPACSPLALSGVCGKALKTRQSVMVPDVKALPPGEHIECDPRNRAELAIPVFDFQGKIWAIFDVDSEQASAFDEMDQRWLERILKSFQEVGKPE